MGNIDYKLALLEIISMIKDKATYLKTIDAKNEVTYDPKLFEGMKMAYHFVMDGIKTYVECNEGMDLSDFGLDNYNPSDILNYKPANLE